MSKFVGGLIPAALSGAFGKENRGFGLGILPGLLYKNKYKDDQEEKTATPGAPETTMKKGGKVKKMAAGGSASKRADGCAQRGKTKGRII